VLPEISVSLNACTEASTYTVMTFGRQKKAIVGEELWQTASNPDQI